MATDPAAEWDTKDWTEDLSELREDPAPPPVPAILVPATTGELVLVPGYTQSAWDRRIARQLHQAELCETYLEDNVGRLPDVILVRNCLQFLGYDRAAARFLDEVMPPAPTTEDGPVYGALVTPKPALPAPKTPRRKPVRKTATDGD